MSVRHLHTRLLLLLAAVVIAALVAATVAFGLSTRNSSAERVARALHAQVVAADALLAQRDRAAALTDLRELEIIWQPEWPPGERPAMPLLVRIESRLGARLPGRAMHLSGTPVRLWVQAQPPTQGWIGIPVLGEGQPLRRGLLFALVAIGALVLMAASLFARSLTRPLRELADAASGIVAGEPPPAPPRFASEEIVELQHALADAAGRTHAAARDRELMLAGISHDMRTPLARLRYALALDEHDTDADARAGMERDIDELDAIVGQFIDYVRDGRDEPLETVDLVAMLQVLGADEARQGRAWRLGLPGRATLNGRPLALRRALTNLFDNAARHGAMPFELELDAMGDGWRLCVFDRGPGVPEPALAELGRPFHRVDRARGAPGSGLGLASVARIAVVHGGGLRLRNREGGGLSVELYLGASPIACQ
jgi:two-component system, OmpR family, osmolarity sensor histidine kinase EnvZ